MQRTFSKNTVLWQWAHVKILMTNSPVSFDEAVLGRVRDRLIRAFAKHASRNLRATA
jgi:hypothetical protein